MEPGFDALQEEPIEIRTNIQQTDPLNVESQSIVFPEEGQENRRTPEENRRLRTNDAAADQLKIFQGSQNPDDPDILKVKNFTNWIEVVVSDQTNLLAKTIKSMEQTLAWLIQSTRQQQRLELSWTHMKEAFNNYLIEIQQKK